MEKETERIIIVTESNDNSANRVINWLYYYKSKVTRKNVNSDHQNFNIKITSTVTTTSLSEHIIWNRRGYLPIIPVDLNDTNLINYLKKEQLPVLSFFEHANAKNYIGSYFKELHSNKLTNLEAAVKSGFDIPETIITNNKIDLFKFVDPNKKYITKSLYHVPNIESENYLYSGIGTILVNLENVSDYFAPSLVQEYIEKEIEIRVFFIEDNFYSMAIFSQNDNQTKIDFRNYNNTKPNTNVPFVLPEEILKNLKLF